MIRVKQIVPEHWVVDGVPQKTISSNEDALYIKPMLPQDFVVSAKRAHHTLILDVNVMKDLIEERRPKNNRYLEKLFKTVAIEMNPVFALTEQRQKYAGASDELVAYADYMERTFNHTVGESNLESFEKTLSDGKPALLENIESLAGYLSAIIYLYHSDGTASHKIEQLGKLVVAENLPIFLLQFYFAGLVFLSKENPDLFNIEDLKKIKSDMKISIDFTKQKAKILNLSNDLALTNTAIFQGGLADDILVFPYIATRDRLCKLFISQVICEGVVDAGHGRVNGIWKLVEGGFLEAHLGKAIMDSIPPRTSAPTRSDHIVRKSNLKAFMDKYIDKMLAIDSSST